MAEAEKPKAAEEPKPKSEAHPDDRLSLANKLALASLVVGVASLLVAMFWNNSSTKVADNLVVNNQSTTNAPTTIYTEQHIVQPPPKGGGNVQPPVERESAPPAPLRVFGGSVANYVAVSAEASIANTIRSGLEFGETLAEIAPQFLEGGYFGKAIDGDRRWRVGLEVPESARMLYLVQVGPLMRDAKSSINGTVAARRHLRIVVFDLAKATVVRTKSEALRAMAFTDEMLDADLEQQILATLRQNVSEIVKHEQT